MNNHLEVMEFIIPSDFRYLGAVDAAFQDLAREFSCSQSCVNDVGTAIIEACSNAIEHGNRFSKDKRVKVVIGLNGETIVARIYDEGKGFDFKKHLSDSPPPEPQSERGRGIIIMKAFTDEIHYTYTPRIGLCIELKKARAGEHDEAPGD
jgi:serine/threonine-protein kinase RsbW